MIFIPWYLMAYLQLTTFFYFTEQRYIEFLLLLNMIVDIDNTRVDARDTVPDPTEVTLKSGEK